MVDIENMLYGAIPILLLFGESEDYDWLRNTQGELMTEPEKVLLETQSNSNREAVFQEIGHWDCAKEIIFDLFEL